VLRPVLQLTPSISIEERAPVEANSRSPWMLGVAPAALQPFTHDVRTNKRQTNYDLPSLRTESEEGPD
jgi:hypothetical protein